MGILSGHRATAADFELGTLTKEAIMSVKVVDRKTGRETTGKYAIIKGGQVNLYTGITSNKKGGWRGCGKRFVFPQNGVTVAADDPAKELKQEG